MRLRPATAHDAKAIADIHAAGWRLGLSEILPAELIDAWIGRMPHAWGRSISVSRGAITVAVDGEQVAGFTSTELARLWAIFVHPDYWGKAVGDLLFADAGQRCGPGLYLHSLRDNHRANRFYERQGLRVVAELNDMFFDYVVPSLIYAR